MISMLLYFLLYDGTHSCIVGEERERTKENSVGLDFSISIENWLKHNCTRDTHYFLHSVCAFFCIFSCCCCLFIFPFFSVVGFPFHPQFFFRCFIFFFFAFYTRDFVMLIFLKPHSFFFTQISLSSIWNGTFVMYGTYIEPTLLHFC